MEVRLIKKTDFLEITQFYAMEKNFFRLYCLMLCVWPMLAGAAEIDSLLDRLDAVIKERPHYIEKKKNRLLELKLRLYPGLPAEERFEQLGLLFEEYRSFNADSSQAIVRERLQLARRLGSPERLANARMNLAEVMGIAGMYKEALERMDSVCLDSLAGYLRPYYFHNLRTFYGWMADYVVVPEEEARYHRLMDCYTDSLLKYHLATGDTLSYVLNRCQHYNQSGRYDDAIRLMGRHLHAGDIHYEALAAYTLAESYRHKADAGQEKKYLAISAIADMSTPVLEYASLPRLAVLLFYEGDVERAYTYLKLCMEDAVVCNARLRILEILKIFPVVNDVYQLQIKKRQRQMSWALVSISLLSVFLVVAVVYVRRQMRRVVQARREVVEANARLKELNDELHRSNASLKEANRSIAENSYLKEEYIGRYMDQCSTYIEKLDAYRRHLGKLAAAGKVQELYKDLKSSKQVEQELKEFYANFDDTFLQLFPTFVEDFNSLLLPDERITPKPGERMNTELRIFALIRLGITDSVKIAQFLRYSVTTIYNYRTRVRNKAAGNREELEGLVARIGRLKM